jgi:ADP-heptose:LPS heptosyltransferase
MGSIIHAIPMLRALKMQYPQARLVFITRKNNKSLFAHIPDVDKVLFVDDSSLVSLTFSNIRLMSSLIRHRIDLFFDLELFSAYGALVSLFSLARNRIGFHCGLDTDFKTMLYTHLMYFNFHMPMRVCYLQLARIAGIADDASSELLDLVIDETTHASARAKLQNILPGSLELDRRHRLLAINVNAAELSVERRWLSERFEAVALYFARKGYHVLFVGNSDERPYVQSVMDRMNDKSDRIHNVAGRFALSEFLALLQECDALLTTDSGIMNFAYALDVPTVSLWGPSNSIQYHVDKGSTHALWKSVYCSPCIHRFLFPPCGGKNICMGLIEVDEVVSALEDLLKGEQPKRHNEVYPACIDAGGNPLGLLRGRNKEENKIVYPL